MNAIANKSFARRADTRDSKDRRQKIVLAGLVVVLVAVLAWQMPKLLGGSGGSSETAAVSETALPVAADPTAAAIQTSAAPVPLTAKEKATARWIKKQAARDPFAPLVGTETSAAGTTTPAGTATPAASGTTPAPAGTTTAPVGKPEPATKKPAAVPKVAPTAAVIWTNGHRQVVGIKQQFKVGDTTFRLLSVNGTTAKIAPVLGGFEGGKQEITIRKSEPVTVENTTTGVQYVLRYSLAMSAVPASGGK